MTPSLEQIAHHEAGHAVAALTLGYPFDRATVVPSGRMMGAVYLFDPTPKTLAAYLIVQLAGRGAEEALTGVGCPAPGDEALVRRFGAGLDPAELDALADEADRLVQERWLAVVYVAEMLMEFGTLSRDELAAVVGPLPAWQLPAAAG